MERSRTRQPWKDLHLNLAAGKSIQTSEMLGKYGNSQLMQLRQNLAAIFLLQVSEKHVTKMGCEKRTGSIDPTKLQEQSSQHGMGWLARWSVAIPLVKAATAAVWWYLTQVPRLQSLKTIFPRCLLLRSKFAWETGHQRLVQQSFAHLHFGHVARAVTEGSQKLGAGMAERRDTVGTDGTTGEPTHSFRATLETLGREALGFGPVKEEDGARAIGDPMT
jgi:hypothetical protein